MKNFIICYLFVFSSLHILVILLDINNLSSLYYLICSNTNMILVKRDTIKAQKNVAFYNVVLSRDREFRRK